MVQKLDREVRRFTCGDHENAIELDSGIKVVLGCFAERGDSILIVFGGELLRVKLQNKQVSWLAN